METIRKKIVIIGDDKCGKTSLVIAFTENIFQQVYVPTEFKNYKANMTHKRKKVELSLCDTSGQRNYIAGRTQCYQDTDVILICFSVDSPGSLENILKTWIPERQQFCQHVPIMLVATKTDLRNNPEKNDEWDKQQIEVIQSKEGCAMAKKINAFAYIECSAKTHEGVSKVFETAIQDTLRTNNKNNKNNCFIC